jgi:hypothetical protein
MKTIKISEATNIQLDWLVATCANVEVEHLNDGITVCLLRKPNGKYAPSTDWSQGGPIIEREWDTLMRMLQAKNSQHGDMWTDYMLNSQSVLVVFMRCYTTSKMGDTAEVPEELT